MDTIKIYVVYTSDLFMCSFGIKDVNYSIPRKRKTHKDLWTFVGLLKFSSECALFQQ